MTSLGYYQFSAYDTQTTIYGYGSNVEALRYCEWLNNCEGMECDHFYFDFIPESEITEDIKSEMVMLSDAVAEWFKEGLTPL